MKQAVEELLPQWAEVDTDDALELLGPSTVDSRVRAFAVKQLTRADDEVEQKTPLDIIWLAYHNLTIQELTLYLLQLVQSLKFESAVSDHRSSRSATTAISYDDSGLTDFLIARGVKNSILGNRLYWYLMVEVALEDRVMAKMYGRVVFKFMNKILEVRGRSFARAHSSLSDSLTFWSSLKVVPKDESSCVAKASSSTPLRNGPANYEHLRTCGPRKSKSSAQ